MSDQDLTISIKATLDGVEEALNTVKDLFDDGSKAAKAMSEMVGGDLSDSFQKLAADSEALGTALEAAFSPMAVISFASAIVDAADKLSKFISDTFIYTDADKKLVDQIKDENKVLLQLASNTKEANRQRQLLMASSDSARDKLKLQFQIEDQGGSAADFKKQREAAAQEIQKLLPESHQTEQQMQILGDFPVEVEVATQKAEEAAAKIDQLQSTLRPLLAKEQEATAREALNQAQFAKDQAREAQQAAQQKEEALRQEIQLDMAKLDAEKKVSDAGLQQQQQALQIIIQQQKLSAEDELALRKEVVDKKFAEDEKYLKDKLVLLNKDPDRNAQQIGAVNARIEALKVQHNTQLLKLDADYYREVEKNGQEAVKKAAANDKKWLADFRAAMEERMQALAAKEKSEDQLEEQAVEQRFELGQISKQQEIAQLAALKQDELQIEINYLKNREQLYQNDAKELRKIEAQIAKDQAEQAQIGAKAVTDALKEQKAQYDKMFSGLTSAFSSFTQSLLSGNQSLGQAWAKMIDDMANKFIQGLERQLMSFLEHKLMEVAIHAQAEASKDAVSQAEHAKEDTRTAYSAAKAAFESAVHTPIIGPILAPIAAAAAFAAVTAFGSAEGGQYLVPGPQLTMLHPQEMVLPAGLASRMRDVVEGRTGGGSGGINVVVNHSVNAVDAESFQGAIRKHGNMIGNEVARVLRRKGFAPA